LNSPLYRVFSYDCDLQGIALDKDKYKDSDDNQDDQLFHNIFFGVDLA
jgi:hypothetical protein